MASDQTVVPNQEGDESSMVFDPQSIQASRTSSVVFENIAARDDLNAGMEPSLPVASSKSSEINEVEAHSSKGMEPSFQATSSMRDPAEDKQNSETGSTSSPQVNPSLKDLPEIKNNKKALAERCSELKKKLDDCLQEEAILAFLEQNNIMAAQEKVEELFALLEDIEKEEGMTMEELVRKTQIPRKDSDQQNFGEYVCRIDIFYHLFKHALACARSKLEKFPTIIDPNYSDSMIVPFMAFLIKKVKEEGIKYPSLDFQKMLQEAWTIVNRYVHLYEEVIISASICLAVNDKRDEAEDLFKRLLKHLKPSDIINRGRVYNNALQKAEDLHQVHKFLSKTKSLSQGYKDLVQHNDRLTQLTKRSSRDVVRKFVEKLYLKDVLQQERETIWEVIEKHDYFYLMKCEWANRTRILGSDSVEQYERTPLQLNYIFTSSAAMTFGGKVIMEELLETFKDCPKLVNAPYKGVTALHVATLKKNTEVIDFLLKQEELDINVRTGRLITQVDVRRYLWNGPEPSTGETPKYASVSKDRNEMITDLLQSLGITVKQDHRLAGTYRFIKNKIAGKKLNKNRWDLPTYQTALHIATTQGHAKVVKLLGDSKKHGDRLRCHEEDEENHTPLDILYAEPKKVAEDFASSTIEKYLLSKQDVQKGIEELYRDRQMLVDAVNTILVGAALIASVTYAGWLQPPLGYAQDYAITEPYPAPPDTYDSYLAVQGNLGVKVFALFNMLSFFFAITTVIVGADAAFPQPKNTYIKHTIQDMQRLLRRAIHFFISSLVCVLGAFGSAAIVVLPPSLFFRKDLVLSIIIGGGLCGFAMWQFLSRHSKKVKSLNKFIAGYATRINKFANVF